MRKFPAIALGLMIAACAFGADIVNHVDICNEEDRFAAWPRNGGSWSWGDEILVGFTYAYFKEDSGHDIDPDRPSEHRFARSMDGGESWTMEDTRLAGASSEAASLTEPMNFLHPDFALHMRGNHFSFSYDRGRSWEGPFAFPDFGRNRLLARTNYLVEGENRLRTTFTVTKDAGGEGVVIHVKTDDGGITWEEIAQVTPEPGPEGYSIMPTTARLSETEWLSVVRRREAVDDERHFWIESWYSDDDGESWTLINKPTEENRGNPGHMIVLRDGRLALVYGHRAEPYGQRARLSSDNGRSWSDEFILRDDGANWDLGYPVSVQRTDGKIVTIYYHNSPDFPGRVYLAATIWDPGEGQGVTPVPEHHTR